MDVRGVGVGVTLAAAGRLGHDCGLGWEKSGHVVGLIAEDLEPVLQVISVQLWKCRGPESRVPVLTFNA